MPIGRVDTEETARAKIQFLLAKIHLLEIQLKDSQALIQKLQSDGDDINSKETVA